MKFGGDTVEVDDGEESDDRRPKVGRFGVGPRPSHVVRISILLSVGVKELNEEV